MPTSELRGTAAGRHVEAIMRAVIVAVALVLAAGAAPAADFPTGSGAPYLTSAYSWTGPYVGGSLGYEFGRITRNPTRPGGIEGGARGGYNWQTGRFVFGGEAELSASAADGMFAPWKFSNPWFGTVRARAGYALNNILFYGTAGLALGQVRTQVAGAAESNVPVGWTAGAGMEVGLNSNWSARVEYLFVDLPDQPYALTGTRNGLAGNILRFGVNYRF